jgi:repressor LexA
MAERQKALTERQRNMVRFIEDYVAEHGYPPTIREIGKQVGISSTSVVNYNLNKLTVAGLIERHGQVSRGLKVQRGHRFPFVPIVGTIAAGEPLRVLEPAVLDEVDVDRETIELTEDIVTRRAGIYALRVKGNSMIDALVNDGDIVVLEQSRSADNGDMVAAWIKDREETTLKRFYSENGQVRLQPANPTMAPIFLDPDNIEVQGRVIAVIRSM